MTTMTLPLCCSRLQSHLTRSKSDLARLAKKAAMADQKNRNIDRLKAEMDKVRAVIRENEQTIIDHDAQHAAGDAA